MSKFVVMATWEDAPHLSAKERADLFAEIPEYQRDARTKGIPQLGSGVIYPFVEEDISVSDFQLPVWWKRIYGFDVGWNWTAACWVAYDDESDVGYVYSVYKRGKAEPPVHAESVKARGQWIPGAVDPASQGSSQHDGTRLMDEYLNLGLNLFPADNAVEAGVLNIYNRLATGRLKVFKSCLPWFEEFRMYRRDEKGKIVKKDDHLMDCTRYLGMSLSMAEEMPGEEDFDIDTQVRDETAGWY